MNSAQFICCRRLGAGSMPNRRKILPRVWSEMQYPRLFNAPAMRSYPQPVFSRHPQHQFDDVAIHCRTPRIAAVFRTVELLSDEFPIPSQDGLRLSDASHLLESLTAEALADFSQRRTLGVGQPEPSGQMCPKDFVFCGQIFAL